VTEKQEFIIRSKEIRHNAARAVSEIASDPIMSVTIKPYKKSKSQEQLGYLFGVVLKKIQEHVEDSTGQHYTTDDLYQWFIEEYGHDRVVEIGGKMKITRRTASRMTTAEMADFITRVIQHAAEHMDCVIPWPEVGMRET